MVNWSGLGFCVQTAVPNIYGANSLAQHIPGPDMQANGLDSCLSIIQITNMGGAWTTFSLAREQSFGQMPSI